MHILSNDLVDGLLLSFTPKLPTLLLGASVAQWMNDLFLLAPAQGAVPGALPSYC